MVYFPMRYDVTLLDSAAGFIEHLQPKLRAKTLRTIDLLAEFGYSLGMPHCQKLTGYELWELRIKQGSDICRLFYFYHDDKVYVVTSGYVKKSNRTSIREIEKAERLKKQFLLEETR